MPSLPNRNVQKIHEIQIMSLASARLVLALKLQFSKTFQKARAMKPAVLERNLGLDACSLWFSVLKSV